MAALIVCASTGAARAQSEPAGVAPLDTATVVATYGPIAERLVGAALVDDTAWRRLEWLSDRIGHRLSGSPQLEAAIAWAVEEMTKDGLEVRREKVLVPRWVRGRESAALVAPFERELSMLGLGNSVGTPPEGVEAEVVTVRGWDELEAHPDVRGKIVLFDVPFTSYGETVAYRTRGPSRAARRGAVAALVRSVGPVSLRTPHTGTLRYDESDPKIPAAALTLEDAALVARSCARGERPRLRLRMEARMEGEVESANVVADLPGRERPDEVVLLCGHLDTWDVGQGSTDDGGGCLAAWEAVRLMKRLGLRPRRTVRAVLYTNEENGLRGAEAYREAHADELARHVLALESDSGVARPSGIGLARAASPRARASLATVASLLRGLGADRLGEDGGGADVGPLARSGVLVGGLDVDESRYFWVHHTPADTFDKLDRTDFGLCVATFAVIAYVVADLEEPLR
jgi:carboxypeptidase Q